MWKIWTLDVTMETKTLAMKQNKNQESTASFSLCNTEKRLPFPATNTNGNIKYNSEVNMLLQNMLQQDPSKRITIESVKTIVLGKSHQLQALMSNSTYLNHNDPFDTASSQNHNDPLDTSSSQSILISNVTESEKC